MKKRLVLFGIVLVSVSISAYGIKNWTETAEKPEPVASAFELAKEYQQKFKSNFFLDVNSRFYHTVTKELLQNAKSLAELIPAEVAEGIESYTNVKIVALPERKEDIQRSNSEVLTVAQLKLFASIPYSNDFYLTADCFKKNPRTGKLESYDLVYYITVVPEKKAEYMDGKEALIEYFRSNSIKDTHYLNEKEILSGRIRFTVAPSGEVIKVFLESSSGFVYIDDNMMELIKKMPGKWRPATNAKGEKIEHQLVFFFGNAGC